MPPPARLSDRVLAAIRRHRMAKPGDRLGVAVSGGGDSVALLHLLEDLRETLGVRLAVVHFNHLLRGEASERDEGFVAELAATHGMEFLARRENVAAWSRRHRSNLEAAGRLRRYAYFRRLVTAGRLERIATGHTADDQAETVLARLVRGTGVKGLAAIHPVLGWVVRPLLDVRRRELREFLTERGADWREDETNSDTNRLRTRIRQRVLPQLETDCGASVARNLARLADLARGDEVLLAELADERFRALAIQEAGCVTIGVVDLCDPWPGVHNAEASRALAARLVRRAFREVQGDLKRLTAEHIQRVVELAVSGEGGDRAELPAGLVAERRLKRMCFFREQSRKRTSSASAS